MFILAPVWHKSEHLPIATALLVLANILIFAIFWPLELKHDSLVSRDEVLSSAEKLAQILLNKDSGLTQEMKDRITADRQSETFPSLPTLELFRRIQEDPNSLNGELRYKWNLQYPVFEPLLKANVRKPGRQTFYNRWGYRPRESDWSGLFTHQFLHAGFVHLLFNMLFLWTAGCVLESKMGWKFLFIYFLGGAAGALAQTHLGASTFDTMVGASGSISALLGFSLIVFPSATVTLFYLLVISISPRTGFFESPLWFFVPLWLFDQIWMSLLTAKMAFVNTGFAAHLGGFAFGAVSALLYIFRRNRE